MTSSAPSAPSHPSNLSTRALPKGWRWVKLGEVCEIIAGQSPPSETYHKSPQGLPFFQGKADFGDRHPVARTWCSAPTKVALPNDILISVRAPVGPTNVADVECCIGRGLAALRCGDGCCTDFILSYLRLVESSLAQLGSGSTFSAISREHLESLEVPLPPLPEQRRIAGILKEQMAAVEKARAAAEAQLQAAKALPAAYLREVFPAPDAPLPEGWKWAKLDDIAERVPTGKQYERLTCKESGKVPVIDQSISGYMGFHDDEAGVLASESNPIVTFANHTCAVRLHRSPFSVIQNVFPLKAKNEVSPTFLYWLLKDRVPQVFYGGHYPKLVAMDLPLPSCSKQREIAEFLSRISLDAERLVVLTQMELGEITALPAALLRQAFSGQL